ncbi:hypothetical protein ACEWY4_006914 [Coilia grayii]|uniref:BAR domain-containing protein n=1 Tax=Coilia grayii TaxID=363190 RepID=A0ABD1KEZ2_9TELE
MTVKVSCGIMIAYLCYCAMQNCDELWEDFHQRLVESTINALENYLAQFPDLKVRVSKRARKLIDYDSARHHLETLQTSNLRNERKIVKAEDDLKKAQKVFDDLNVGLQDELPTLWDSRVGFYVNTFKSVTSLEAKFHREISMLCHKLYEVMNKLAEQHSDKMFTIQGAPSDSGPLRLARTPTPPDESPPESPDANPNHMLRPTSPGPPRPKSPSQLKKGPPVPPPPKVTPTKDIQQEQIIDLFDSAFPVATPSTQPNERPGESLLDLDFDPFPTTAQPIGQSQSPMPQGGQASVDANPSLPAFPDQAVDAGFTVDWSANFSIPATGTEGANAPAVAAAAPASDGWPPASGWATEAAQPPVEPPAGDEVRGQGPSEQTPEPNPERDPCDVVQGQAELAQEQEQEREQDVGQGQEGMGAGWAPEQAGWGWGEQQQQQAAAATEEGVLGEAEGDAAVPGIVFTDEFGQEVQGGAGAGSQVDMDGSGSEYETAEEWGDTPGHNGGYVSADDELAAGEGQEATTEPTAEQGAAASSSTSREGFADWGAGDAAAVFPEQVPVADTGFGGEGFAVQWDQPVTTELTSEEPNSMVPPVQQGALDAPQTAPGSALDNTDSASASDPFGTDADPFGTENDPFGTGKDPFASSEDPFGTSETDPFGSSDKDPFADSEQDLFANQAAEAQVPEDGQTAGFTSDPFAESTKQGSAADSGWATDPFSNTNAQGWPGGWDSASGGEAKDSAQWAAFPNPSATEVDPSAKGSWQEVSDSSGFFSSDGQGDFTAGWGGDGGSSSGTSGGGGGGNQPQDFFAAFPSPTEPLGAKAPEAEGAPSPREPENSDLSEDEVANRRYGKLYQEIDTEKDEVSNSAFNGFPQTDTSVPAFAADFDKMEGAEDAAAPGAAEAPETEAVAEGQETEGVEGQVTTPPASAEAVEAAETTAASPPGEKAPTPAESPVSADNVEGVQTEESAAVPEAEKESPTAEAPASAEDKGSPIEEAPAEVTQPEGEGGGSDGAEQKAGTVEVTTEEAANAAQPTPVEGATDSVSEEEKMPIPSVVIEPASSNEGDDDRDVDILSPTATSDNGVAPTPDSSSGVPGMPPGFLYKVEAMHDFDAENTDELNLKQGDIVLVIPTVQAEDQVCGPPHYPYLLHSDHRQVYTVAW